MGLFSFSLGGNKSSAKSTTETSVTKMDAASKKILDNLTSFLQSNTTTAGAGFDKTSAINDASGVIKNLFDQFHATVVPQIATGMQTGGIYNSTQGQQLVDEAFGRTTANASQVVLDNIAKYAGIRQQDQGITLSALLNALNLQAGAVSNTVENSKGRSSSLSFGLGGGK